MRCLFDGFGRGSITVWLLNAYSMFANIQDEAECRNVRANVYPTDFGHVLNMWPCAFL